jgi:hypothetical protein
MRKLIATGALLLAASLIPATLAAQTQSDKPATTSSMSNPNVTSVTGCVQAGKKAGTYKLMADDGTTYMLRSKSTNLAEHVGHTVTVSGHIMTGEKRGPDAATTPANSSDSASAAAADQNASGDSSTPPAGAMRSHLMVRSLTMVSDSCKTK